MSAGAATTYSSTLTTIDALKITTLDKYLVMKADANVPNAKFTFSVTSGDPVAAEKGNGTLAVLAGVGSPALTNSTMTFSTGDTATPESAKGADTPVFLTEDTLDEKYVKKTLTLDFFRCQIYRARRIPLYHHRNRHQSGCHQRLYRRIDSFDGQNS